LFLILFRVTSVAFNSFHDQLVLSGGTDARVNLWRVSSVSSTPLLELGDEEIFGTSNGVRKSEPKMAADVSIRNHDDHDDSVYSAVWSAHTAWVYASLSAQGKVVISQVPAAEKYKILL
jgi:EARP and GARP complex-interacting protein 1